MKIFRDSAGTVINIGDWDLLEEEVEVDGIIKLTQHNPIPHGAIESDEEVVIGWDGGLYVRGDPRAVKK